MMDAAPAQAFTDEAIQSAVSFRTFLDAMSRPGTVHNIPVDPEGPRQLKIGSALALLTLCDHESPIWLCESLNIDEVQEFIRFNCSSPITTKKADAMFAVFDGMPDFNGLNEFSIGTADYPDRSLTMVIQVDTLSEDLGVALKGPGIKSVNYLKVEGVNDEFWIWWRTNNSRFPLGIDVILASDNAIAALPRTVQVMETV